MIVLHHVAQSRSFRVLWLLEELGLEYSLVHHDFFDRGLRAPQYLRLSPAGRVPALEIDGQHLCESGAIVQYLCERAGQFLGQPPERARWLEGLHYAETLGAHLANLTQHHIMLRDPAMRSPTVMRLEAMRLSRALAGLGDRLCTGPDAGLFWLGSGFSAADIALAYGARIGRHFLTLDDQPRLQTWLGALESRPAYRRALEREGAAQIYTKPFYAPPEADARPEGDAQSPQSPATKGQSHG